MKFYKPKRSALKESNTIKMNRKICGCNNTNRVCSTVYSINFIVYNWSMPNAYFFHTAINFRCFSFNKYIIYLTFLSCFLVFVVMKNCIGLTLCLDLSLSLTLLSLLLSLYQTTWIRKKLLSEAFICQYCLINLICAWKFDIKSLPTVIRQ